MAFNGTYKTLDSVLNAVKKYPFMENMSKREAAHALVTLLELVGAIIPFERKYKNIEIKLHKGELPTDVVFIHGVNNKGNSCDNLGIAMRYSSDIYLSVLHSEEAKKVCGTTITTDTQIEQIYPPTLADGATTVDGLSWGDPLSAPANNVVVPVGAMENSYNINAMSIDTSFAEGWVEMAYDAVKCDEEGFPMIPNNASFRNAFKYYLLKEAAEPEYLRGAVSDKAYREIDQQYSFYVGQAQSSFNMPSPDQMATLAAGLMRIIPRDEGYKTGWAEFNKKE